MPLLSAQCLTSVGSTRQHSWPELRVLYLSYPCYLIDTSQIYPSIGLCLLRLSGLGGAFRDRLSVGPGGLERSVNPFCNLVISSQSFNNLFSLYRCAAELAGMEREIDQLVQAISIASDPSQISLHQQALAYLSTIQENTNETWRLALHLFVDQNPNGSRKYPSQARFFGLRVLDELLDNR